MAYLPLLSILLELVIAILFILAALKHHMHLVGLALTFAIYVFYDLSKLYEWTLDERVLPAIFFVATLAALWSAWGIYKDAR